MAAPYMRARHKLASSHGPRQARAQPPAASGLGRPSTRQTLARVPTISLGAGTTAGRGVPLSPKLLHQNL